MSQLTVVEDHIHPRGQQLGPGSRVVDPRQFPFAVWWAIPVFFLGPEWRPVHQFNVQPNIAEAFLDNLDNLRQ